jgi:hypothetical protein
MINIIKAILKFQNECPKVTKDSKNPFFKSKYADLASIWETIQPILSDNGLCVVQPIMGDCVITILYHTSGEFIESLTQIIAKEANNPQAYGSAITYARRYALQSILSVVAEDDDGNVAAGNKAVVREQPRAKDDIVTSIIKEAKGFDL